MSTLAISSGGIPLKEDYSLKIHQQSPRYQTCSGTSSAAGSRIYLQLYSSRTRSNIVTSKRSSRLPTGLCSLWPLLPLLMLLGLSPLSALVQKAAAAGTELNNCKIESNGKFKWGCFKLAVSQLSFNTFSFRIILRYIYIK